MPCILFYSAARSIVNVSSMLKPSFKHIAINYFCLGVLIDPSDSETSVFKSRVTL